MEKAYLGFKRWTKGAATPNFVPAQANPQRTAFGERAVLKGLMPNIRSDIEERGGRATRAALYSGVP